MHATFVAFETRATLPRCQHRNLSTEWECAGTSMNTASGFWTDTDAVAMCWQVGCFKQLQRKVKIRSTTSLKRH